MLMEPCLQTFTIMEVQLPCRFLRLGRTFHLIFEPLRLRRICLLLKPHEGAKSFLRIVGTLRSAVELSQLIIRLAESFTVDSSGIGHHRFKAANRGVHITELRFGPPELILRTRI